MVTGEVGTGKTMLCRSMLESFEPRTFLSVILDPGLEVEDLLRQVLTDFGIMNGVDAPKTGPLSEVTRHQFVSTLQRFLASLIPLQAHAVIMIDEAQRLNARVLEEIRLLSNFETDQAKLLQIVLVGQPELEEILRRPDMRQLNQRVARRCQLHPLSETEVGDYIERRLTVAASPDTLAGSAGTTSGEPPQLVRFSPEAVALVATISEGMPRVVNTLCDRTLDVAYERQSRTVDADAVRAAAARLALDVPPVPLPGRRRLPAATVGIAATVAAVAAVGWWATSGSQRQPPPQTGSTASAPAAAASEPRPPQPSQDSGTAAEPADAPGGSSAARPPIAGGDAGVAASSSSTPPSSPEVDAGAERFEIAVAAFRTEARASEVVTSLKALQIPASVRIDSTGTWQQVMAGPFATRDAAQAAQEALTQAGYTDTRITTRP